MAESIKNWLNQETVLIRKQDGQLEEFSEEKLVASLRHSGAHETLVQDTLSQIRDKIYPEMSTKEIYQLAFRILRSKARSYAARYNLKRAVMSLGPSGYPFEKFVASIFQREGWATRTNNYLDGKCAQHEIDVEAVQDSTLRLMECKFRNLSGYKVDLRIALYVFGRAYDLDAIHKPEREFFLVTNAHFSRDAIRFSNCSGVKLLGWSYPHGEALREKIERTGLYPITCITRLKRAQHKSLIELGIVQCDQLAEKPDILNNLRLSAKVRDQVLEEANDIVQLAPRKKTKASR